MSIETPDDANIHAEFCTNDPRTKSDSLISLYIECIFFKTTFYSFVENVNSKALLCRKEA